MEVLGWIFIILLVIGLWNSYITKKRKAVLTAAFIVGTLELTKSANRRLLTYYKECRLPKWYAHSSEELDQHFFTAVRALTCKEGIPVPRTEEGNKMYDCAALIAASAMEAAGGDSAFQILYASSVIKTITNLNGEYCFDKSASMNDFYEDL